MSKFCKKCGECFEGSNVGQADPCLGELPGVDNACCGHGDTSQSYVRFTTGVVLKGFSVEYTPRWERGRELSEVISFLEEETSKRKEYLQRNGTSE